MATPSSFPWGTVLLMTLGVGAAYYAFVPSAAPMARQLPTGYSKERFVYMGIAFTVQRDGNEWLGCFGRIGGEEGECWPGATHAAAFNRTRQRIDARLNVETPPRKKRIAKAKGRPRTRARRR